LYDLSGVPFYNENGARATFLQVGTPGVSCIMNITYGMTKKSFLLED